MKHVMNVELMLSANGLSWKKEKGRMFSVRGESMKDFSDYV